MQCFGGDTWGKETTWKTKHSIHNMGMYSVISPLCVCFQTNLLTANTSHSAIFTLFILYSLYSQDTIQHMHSVIHHL